MRIIVTLLALWLSVPSAEFVFGQSPFQRPDRGRTNSGPPDFGPTDFGPADYRQTDPAAVTAPRRNPDTSSRGGPWSTPAPAQPGNNSSFNNSPYPAAPAPRNSATTETSNSPPNAASPYAQAADTGNDRRPQVWHQSNFGIPFQIPRDNKQASRVVLYVSTDYGKQWSEYQSQPIDAQGFNFRASADGEYWFSVRTLDHNGRFVSQKAHAAGLKVIVDTTAPRLELYVSVDGNGQAHAEWFAEDANLAPHRFRMQYQDLAGQWREVPVNTPNADQWQQHWQEKTQWYVGADLGQQLVVRAEIRDRAGNPAVVTKRAGDLANRNDNVARAPSADNSADGFHWRRPAAASTDASANSANNTSSASSVGDRNTRSDWRNNSQRPVFSNVAAPVANPPGRSPYGQPTRGGTQQQQQNDRWSDTASRAGGRPAYSSQPAYSQSQPREPAATGMPPLVSSTPEFALEYDVYDVGPQGVKMVELWVTRDGGRSWELHGSDVDRQSPFEVRLKEEGLYGFRLAVTGFDSPAPPQPLPGDPADMYVVVDWNKPLAKILRAEYVPAQQALVIEWTAEDTLLARNPISLSYATSANGQWQRLADQQPNSGTFSWPMERAPHGPLFIQLEVVDQAGSVSTATYDVQAGPRQNGLPRGRFRRQLRPLERRTASRF